MGVRLAAVALALSLSAAPRALAPRQEPAAPPPPAFADVAAEIASGDPARGWAAIQGLRALGALDAQHKKAAQRAATAWSVDLQASKDEAARVVRAHALGALGPLGLPAAPALLAACSDDRSARVRLACALALAELGAEVGADADKTVAKGVQAAELVGGALACAALARPGAGSAAGEKALRDAARRADTFRRILLTEPALVALEVLGEDVSALLAEREKARAKVEIPAVSGLNWSGIVEQVPGSFFAPMRELLALSQPPTLEGYAMPAVLRPLAHTQALYECYGAALGHLPRATGELLPALRGGELATLDDYSKRVQPWVHTVELLMRVEERFVPAKEK